MEFDEISEKEGLGAALEWRAAQCAEYAPRVGTRHSPLLRRS